MATDRRIQCKTCGQIVRPTRMFDALLDIARSQLAKCSSCGKDTELHLEFSLGLDAGRRPVRVLGAFTSPVAWNNINGDRVTFYPFLVVVASTDGEHESRSVWLPYWHNICSGGTRTIKYGQWAPFMDSDIFEELYASAVIAGVIGEIVKSN